MNDKTENQVVELYRAYQSSRRKDDINTRFEILSDIRGTDEEALTPAPEADKDDEEFSHILALYRDYQRTRDRYRDQILANVFAAAEQRNASSSATSSIDVSTSPGLNSFIERLNRFFKPANLFQWQSIAAFAAVILVVGIITLVNVTGEHENTKYLADARTLLLDNSEVISDRIQPPLNEPLAFSSNSEPYHYAFRLGIIATDIPVLIKANRRDSALTLINNSNALMEKSDNKALTELHGELLSALENNADPRELLVISQHFSDTLEAYFLTEDLGAVFKLGEWLEITLLTTYIISEGASGKLSLLLSKGRKISNAALSNLSEDQLVTRLIQDFQEVDMDPGDIPDSSKVRTLRNKLQQIKASLL